MRKRRQIWPGVLYRGRPCKTLNRTPRGHFKVHIVDSSQEAYQYYPAQGKLQLRISFMCGAGCIDGELLSPDTEVTCDGCKQALRKGNF